MDVRCGLCGTEYDFDDALISERGTTVQCTECGFQFKVYPEQPLSGVERWIVRSGSGAGWEREYTSLKDLQQAIQQGDVGPADLLSRGGSEPRPLAAIAELEPLFRQRVVRSGGTLLGMMPGPGAGPGAAVSPGVDPHSPPAEVTSGRRRVATKLGLPMAPIPAPTPDGGPPATPPAVTPPPVFDEPAPAPEQGSPATSHTLARTLPSAVTPSPVADRAEAPPRHPSAPRQRIVSLLSAGEEETAQAPSRDKLAWAAQTLPSTPPHGAAPVVGVAGANARADVPGVEENAVPEVSKNVDATSAAATSAAAARAAVTSPSAGVGAAGGAVARNHAATESASVTRASEAVARRPVAARDLDEPEIVIPARRGGARWAVGAVALAAGAAALWGWSRAADSGAAPSASRATQPNVAAAETVPTQSAAQDDAPNTGRTSPSTEATEEPPAGSGTVAPELRAATADPADASPRKATAPETSKGTVDYRTRLSGASAALRSGDLARAQGLYEAVLRDQPGNVEATSGLAEVAQRRGQTQKSAELYDRVLANNPSYAPALIGRGDQLWAAGKRQGAVELYRRVVDQLGTTGTYGGRAQSRIEEARRQPEEPPAPDRAAQSPAEGVDSAAAEPAPAPEVSENPTSSPVDDTESDE